jgi:ABC-type Na+ efflux pump permease subunit
VNKIRTVAAHEFRAAVQTKAFLISIIMLPLIWGGSIFIQIFVRKSDVRTLRCAVLDHTGRLYPALEAANALRNRSILNPDGSLNQSPFEIEPATVSSGQSTDAALLALSDRVRRGELFAFLEIPTEILQPAPDQPAQLAPSVRYHSQTPNEDRLRDWIAPVINAEAERLRFADAGVDMSTINRLRRFVSVDNLGLVTPESLAARAAAAAATATDQPGTSPPTQTAAAERVDPIRTIVVPAILTLVVFMIVLSSTPLLMNSVIEEKMSRISEVLLGSVTPFELLLGKLIGNVGVSLVLSSLYLGVGYLVASRYGYGQVVPAILWFYLAIYLILAVLLFGSMFITVGAACNDLKDAQTLMLPVMLLVMLPMFLWSAVIQNPNGPLATAASLFPPATPFLMLLRLAMQPGPPAWQLPLSILLTTITALFFVWAAGRVLRVGLLMQGKTPSFPEIARWVFAR